MKDWILKSLVLFLGVATAVSQRSCLTTVPTRTGLVRGKSVFYKGRKMNLFYGIPFAQPPVGNLRFKTTVPVKRWNHVLNATQKAPACLQVPFDVESLDKESPQNENCLYLNIWVPCRKERKAPMCVMFWIYGGNFWQGSGSMSIYNGFELALEEVIVVTMNYRVGIFGFAFSNSTDAPGNAGMYDQAEALRWVKENIMYFGGNPSCITLFGQSAGAISNSLHTVSPLTSNLFNRVITESGSAVLLISGLTPVLNLNTTDAIAEAVNCSSPESNIRNHPDEVMKCMRTKDPETLIKYSLVHSFTPQYGDSFAPKDPREEILSGRSKNCDRLTGVTRDEGSLFWARQFLDTYGRYGEKVQEPTLTKTEARPMMQQALLRFGIPPSVSASMIDYYLGRAPDGNNTEILVAAYTAVGDNVILCPSVYEAEKAADRGNKVYYYKLLHRPTCSNAASWAGVTHFSDVPYVLGLPLQNKSCCTAMLVEGKNCSNMQFTEAEVGLSREMIQMWTNFAKTGSPNSRNSPRPLWPLYSKQRPNYLKLDTTPRFGIGQGPHRKNCNFLRPIYGA